MIKKAVILSGAYKNAGDFLIVDRCMELMKYVYPDICFIQLPRNVDLNNNLEEINSCDVLVLAGGPLYFRDAYPRIIPLVDNLEKIKIKIVTIGCGLSALDDSIDAIYTEFKLDAKMEQLLRRIEKDQGYLSCRDWKTIETLRNCGFKKTLMTGCPAWYDLKSMKDLENKKYNLKAVKKIYISDPAYIENLTIVMDLVKYLKEVYPTAEIAIIFHRGIGADKYTQKKVAKKYCKLKEKLDSKVEFIDISYGKDGFQYYDQCDLHIGFRVHAHIYNISKGNLSILIEEDFRGGSINDTLGFERIKAYENNRIKVFNEKNFSFLSKVITKLHKKHRNNYYVIKQVDFYIDKLQKQEFRDYKISLKRIKKNFNDMIACIKNI